MDLINRMGVLFTAIATLTREEAPQFYREYVKYLGDPQRPRRSHLAIINPEEAARRNIIYALPYFDKDISEKWVDAIPELRKIF